MHRKFRELLNDAEGISEFVIVIVVDIRNFSGEVGSNLYIIQLERREG
jgi:hypothetical protein